MVLPQCWQGHGDVLQPWWGRGGSARAHGTHSIFLCGELGEMSLLGPWQPWGSCGGGGDRCACVLEGGVGTKPMRARVRELGQRLAQRLLVLFLFVVLVIGPKPSH